MTALTSAVPGRDDLTCPLPRAFLRKWQRWIDAHPWRGDTPIENPRHFLDTTSITEPGRPIRLLYSLDYGYHSSGWFANSDYDQCWHLSISHPGEAQLVVVEANGAVGPYRSAPTDDEARAWGLVLWGPDRATWAWFEPAVGPGDPYRSPGVVHLRLYRDKLTGEAMMPRGEVYDLRPWADGSSPAKILDGRLGADVR